MRERNTNNAEAKLQYNLYAKHYIHYLKKAIFKTGRVKAESATVRERRTAQLEYSALAHARLLLCYIVISQRYIAISRP